MNTTELAARLAASHGWDKAQARRLLDSAFAAVAAMAGSGEEVVIAGFGRFKVTERAARQGRNPATGETIQIAASRKLAFAPAKQVRDALNPASGEAGAKPAGGKAAAPPSKAKGAAKPKAGATAAPAPAKGKKAG